MAAGRIILPSVWAEGIDDKITVIDNVFAFIDKDHGSGWTWILDIGIFGPCFVTIFSTGQAIEQIARSSHSALDREAAVPAHLNLRLRGPRRVGRAGIDLQGRVVPPQLAVLDDGRRATFAPGNGSHGR